MATKKTTPKKLTPTAPAPPERSMPKLIGWVLLAGLWLLVTASLVGFDPADPPSHAAAPLNAQPANFCGIVGAYISHELYLMLGQGVWLLVLAALAYLIITAAGRPITQLPLRIAGAAVMAVAASAIIALILPGAGSLPEGSGGLLAIWLVTELAAFQTFGEIIIFMTMLIIGAILVADQWVARVPVELISLLRRAAGLRIPRPAFAWARRAASNAATLEPHTRRPTVRREVTPDDDLHHEEPDEEDGDVDQLDHDGDHEPEAHDEEPDDQYEQEEPIPDPDAPATTGPDLDAIRAKIANLPVAANRPQPAPTVGAAPLVEQDLSGYKFPGIDLLIEPESQFTEQQEQRVREQAEILEQSLQTYKIQAEVVAIDPGPVITLFEVQLAPGTKVSALNRISSDLARALKSQNVRIVPNTAGKSTVGVEVPNLEKEKVRLKELMTIGGKPALDAMALPMFLGKDASGNPVIADLATMPHMLIAGTTGSGKSVCMNSIIVSFLLTRKPDEVKLVLVDPKMVEMAAFKNIPLLMCPVVTEMARATAILEWATVKMDERYELLAEAGVRDLAGYNKLTLKEKLERFDPADDEEAARIPKKLPRLVFIIDELADLMITNKDVEGHIVRIAQKARAVGIHLILATQRPQANVVTGLIKSNMPCRISFKVASSMDSRIVLDSKGAELLLGQGDMLYLSPRSSKLTRAQGTLVDEIEIRRVVRFLKEFSEPSFEPQLLQLRAPSVDDEGELDDDEFASAERDPLFEKAVEVVLETQRGSVSLLQRRLTIGYSRSSRLIEQIYQAGIIGEHKGSQAREVLMNLDDWHALQAQIQADAEAAADPPTVNTQDLESQDADAVQYETDDDEDEEITAELDTDTKVEQEVEEEDTEDDEELEYEEGESEEDEDAEEEAEEEAEDEEDDDEYEYEYVDEEEDEADEEEDQEEEEEDR
ncbi:MAG: hypothetical protein CMJ49_14090 [Planctomycetaceae bacterium]|nr:hypothetical protein [Planctomycetaceae bacterium]